MWLHTKNIPGSHVIVCSTDIPDNTLIEVPVLGAHYIKKRIIKVDVDYTLVKNLKKPNGANPGMVIYHTNYTMTVEPSEINNLNIVRVSSYKLIVKVGGVALIINTTIYCINFYF